MARDRSLRLSFTAVTSATNVNQVRVGLGSQTAIIAQSSTASQYAFGYSDAENLNFFNSTLGDAASFAAQANASADGVSAPLISSTSDASYYVRAAIGQTGFCGPRPQTVTLQAATSTGPSAPSQASDEWATAGTAVYFPATCSVVSATTSGTTGAMTGATFTPGSIIRTATAAGAGFPVGGHFIALTSTTLAATSGAALSSVTGSTAVTLYVNVPAASTQFTVSAYSSTTGELTSSAPVQLNDAVVFSSVTGTTWAANTMYYVNGITANGFTLAASMGGSTILTGTITAATGIYFRTQTNPVIFINDTTATTLTARNILSGAAISHGFSVGDVLVIQAGTVSSPSLAAGDAVVVSEVVSLTEFKVSTTVGGSAIALTSPSGVQFYPIRGPRLVPIQIDKTTRQWFRLAQQNFNGTSAQTGHMAVLYADVCPGRDGSYVLR